MTEPDRRDLGRVFNEVPGLYDRVRPTYPDESSYLGIHAEIRPYRP